KAIRGSNWKYWTRSRYARLANCIWHRKRREQIRIEVIATVQLARQRDFLRVRRITQLQRQIFAQRQSPLQRTAIGFGAVGKIGAGERLFREQVDAHAGSIIEKVGLRVAELDAADELAVGHACPGKAAGAQEVALGDRNFRQPAVGGR